jgi:pilus assembly protein Flp/PilA
MVSVVVRLVGRTDPDRERGQGLAEYALILALIAIIAIIALVFLGNNINTILSDVGNEL